MNKSGKKWREIVLREEDSILQAIERLNVTGLQIILVVDSNDILIGTLTDGDIRRRLLTGLDLQGKIKTVMCTNVLSVSTIADRQQVEKIMKSHRLSQLPVVDDGKKLVGLHLWDDISPVYHPNLMVIMAGGMGKRLLPLTEKCPKPMLLIGDKPILEHLILKARDEGFRKFVISIGYLGYIIEEYFSDGSAFDVEIEYLREDKPTGTAGALRQLKHAGELPFLVTNGDVLCDVKYSDLLRFHRLQGADATMAVHLHQWQHAFGVVDIDDGVVTNLREKPMITSYINAGLYCFNKKILGELLDAESFDMTDMFLALINNKKRVLAYPLHESWTDVGLPRDLQRIRDSFEN
jgi:dTDP-glucose pyrophosphorylase